MRIPLTALAAVVGLGLTLFPLAYAATTTTAPTTQPTPTAAPKTPDVAGAAKAYVDQITQAPVCTPEDGSTASYSCTTLAFGTPFSFRCVTTATSTVCAVPLAPEVTAGEVILAPSTVSDAPTHQ
jgi:hypothetical protein